MGPNAAADFGHEPVLVHEVLEGLGPALQEPGVVVDCTVGGGGHAEALLCAYEQVTVIGMDRDDQAIATAKVRLEAFGERIRLVKADFRSIDEVVESCGYEQVRGFLYDLGVSSAQLDQPERGFSYRASARLDMRMDQGSGTTAADVVNKYSIQQLQKILTEFGEERFARRVASAIVTRRRSRPFSDTTDLADVVREAIPAAARRSGPHPARRTFQALRIEVNDELESLRESLEAAVDRLEPGGRLSVISYHSLEDRIVKRFFRRLAADCTCPKDLPVCVCGSRPDFKVLTRRPVRPGAAEIERNPRADSGRLRVAEKLAEAA